MKPLITEGGSAFSEPSLRNAISGLIEQCANSIRVCRSSGAINQIFSLSVLQQVHRLNLDFGAIYRAEVRAFEAMGRNEADFRRSFPALTSSGDSPLFLSGRYLGRPSSPSVTPAEACPQCEAEQDLRNRASSSSTDWSGI
jgi:hypothetical protein